MKYIFVDTETISIPSDTSKPINDIDNWPAIRQIAWIVCNEYGTITKECNYVISSRHSVDDTLEHYCPQEVKPIHKIIPALMEDLKDVVYIIGHNIEYDIKVIGAEMYRLGHGTASIGRLQQICTMKSSVEFCGFAGRTDSRYPKLQELYTKLFHEPFVNAHDAFCDIYATYECFWELVDRDIIKKEEYIKLFSSEELETYIDSLNCTPTKYEQSSITDLENLGEQISYSSCYDKDEKAEKLSLIKSLEDKARVVSNRYISANSNIYKCSIPNGVKAICDHAFTYCRHLEEVVIPDSVMAIGVDVFPWDKNNLSIVSKTPFFLPAYNGHALYDVVHNRIVKFFRNPKTVKQSRHQNLDSYDNNDILVISSHIDAYAFYGSGIKKITILDGYKIGANAFADCKDLYSVSLPNELSEIPAGLVYGCDALQSINIPYSVERINGYSFKKCGNLKSINLPVSVNHIGAGAFEGCTGIESFTIPDNVTSIEDSTFQDCTGLESITIHDNVTAIGKSAFKNCSSLQEIHIPESVSYFGESAFEGCSSIKSIHIPDSIRKLSKHTFKGCRSLEQIVLPPDLSVIDSNPFEGCPLIIIKGNDYFDFDGSALVDKQNHRLIAYLGHALEYTVHEDISEISEGAFQNCTSLRKLNISGKVKVIRRDTFKGCRNLEELIFPDSVETIECNALENCSSLVSLRLPKAVAKIEKSVFDGCRSLTSFIIDNPLIKVDADIPPTLENIYIPKGTKKEFMDNTIKNNIRLLQFVNRHPKAIMWQKNENQKVGFWKRLFG